GVLTGLFGPDYHFTVGSEGLPGVIRSFDGFGAAAAEAGQSRIYGGIHYQFDNQNALASGHALAQFVVGNMLRPVEHEDEGAGEQAAVRAAGLALLLGGPGKAASTGPDVLGGQQDGAPASGQPTPKQTPQPTDVRAARA